MMFGNLQQITFSMMLTIKTMPKSIRKRSAQRARDRCPRNNRNYSKCRRINICIFTLPSRLFSSKLPKLNNYRPADVRSTRARRTKYVRFDRLMGQRSKTCLFIDLGSVEPSRAFMTKSCENDLRLACSRPAFNFAL